MDAVFAFASKMGHAVLFFIYFCPSELALVVVVVLLGSHRSTKASSDCRTGTEHCAIPVTLHSWA